LIYLNIFQHHCSCSIYRFLQCQVLNFTKSNCRDFIANDAWPHVSRLQSTKLPNLGPCWSLITTWSF